MILSAEEWVKANLTDDNCYAFYRDTPTWQREDITEIIEDYATYKLKALIEEVLSDDAIGENMPVSPLYSDLDRIVGAKWAKSELLKQLS